MMQAIGRRYVGSFNARYGRTGTLWEGRFKAALVECERYLLTCYRYVELNPVRAGMVAHPAEYRWSSYHCNAGGADEARIQQHPCYVALGADLDERRESYRSLFDEALASEEIGALRAHTHQQRAWGSERFRIQVESPTQRAASLRPRGRPHSNE